MCLLCYLDSYNQHNIRETIQLRTDRFEHALNRYKLQFLHEFKENIKSDLCEIHNSKENYALLELLKNIPPIEINNFFDTLEKIYLFWIDSKPTKALNLFKNLLKNHKILSLKYIIDEKVLFRGRQCESILSHWDMFHIPFNKRYLIGNQRYSLVGQPLLYLASSPLCVISELRNCDNIKISSFRINNASKKSNVLKLFDNSFNLLKFIKVNNENPLNESIDQMIIDDDFNQDGIRKYFFQYLLACCCSFKTYAAKRKFTFCEEYVLPQLLAQLVKETGFDGIVFNSTICYDNKYFSNNPQLYNLLCKNFCVFTKYNHRNSHDITYVYDKILYKKFIISSPLMCESKICDNISVFIEETQDLLIDFIGAILNLKDYIYYLSVSSNFLLYIQHYKILLKNINKSNNLSKTEKTILENSIKLHILSIRNIIFNMRDEINLKEDWLWN
ncbi:MAG: hypothetical protein ACLRYN_15180 [Clostridium perfringens]|uniref:hypothetical protein n=1 Tax=Clostridium perfringens TaxID=1502 RepID=UPI000D712C38|nr:hypothetical protein [Clostridium perfringens]EGT4142286.1 hypothetical protein [Clostridium perfringens]MBO3302477.1 hypothetical protein [Clostridium perfringens]MBO3305802.1 hypothetical protein [Clostridium perfringens]MBO3310258.1 hypothetical protein [Clostridium perfringens]MBO3316547.1 hypothetical protein [Clostridium perfringens]